VWSPHDGVTCAAGETPPRPFPCYGGSSETESNANGLTKGASALALWLMFVLPEGFENGDGHGCNGY
jgi:hypothetical protein